MKNVNKVFLPGFEPKADVTKVLTRGNTGPKKDKYPPKIKEIFKCEFVSNG